MGKLNKQSSGVGKYMKYYKEKSTGGDLPDNHQQTKAIICPNCSGEGKDMRNGSKHCEYCDFWW